jgi:hypothetical protein
MSDLYDDPNWEDTYREEQAASKKAEAASKKAEAASKKAETASKKAEAAAKNKERKDLQAKAQAIGQVILVDQEQNKSVVVAPFGSVMTPHNTVLSPDGWETVVPRGTVLDNQRRR